MRRAARTDSTQSAIVAALRSAGCLVWIVGKELDLVVKRGRQLYLIDCKSRGAPPTENQRDMVRAGWPVHFCESAEQALAAVGLKA